MFKVVLNNYTVSVSNEKLTKNIDLIKGIYRFYVNKNDESLLELNKEYLSVDNIVVVTNSDDSLVIYDKKNNTYISFDRELHFTIYEESINEENVLLKEYVGDTKVLKAEKDFSLSVLEGHKVSEEYCDFKAQLNFYLDEDTKIYGLGDKASPLNRRGFEYISYNTDDPSAHNESYKSLYKSINYVILNNSYNNYVGICYLSTYKTIFNLGCYKKDLFYIATNYGEYDFYVILGNKPYLINYNYHHLFNRPYLPPIKMLGHHQSRWSYRTQEEAKAVIDNYRKNNLPLDYINLDIDYMIKYKVFTVDENKFNDMNGLVQYAYEKGIKLIPIIDPAVKVEQGYEIFDQMLKNNLFATLYNEPYINEVWPGESMYPNYFYDKCQEYIAKTTENFLEKYKFGGIWTDMNEPASFKGPLPDNVEFFDGEKTRYHDQVHNLYAYYMVKSMAEGFLKLDRRPNLITRAAFNGSNRYTTSWNGDNQSLWSHLQTSLPQVATMNLCDFVFNGVDIGGFGGECNKELLIRWVEANVFSAFFRNHATINSRQQEPYAFDEQTLTIYKKMLNLHYKLIPTLYSQAVLNNLNGSPIVAPMFFYYSDDKDCKEINDQIMISNSLIHAPITTQGTYYRTIYLPKGTWTNIYNPKETYKGPTHVTTKVGIDETKVFLNSKGFYIETKEDILSINESLDGKKVEKIKVRFVLGKDFKQGYFYVDDGVSIHGKVRKIKVTRTKDDKVKLFVCKDNFEYNLYNIDKQTRLIEENKFADLVTDKLDLENDLHSVFSFDCDDVKILK